MGARFGLEGWPEKGCTGISEKSPKPVGGAIPPAEATERSSMECLLTPNYLAFLVPKQPNSSTR